MRADFDAQRASAEKEVQGLKERSRNETNSLIEEIKKLQDIVEENRDQEQMRRFRRENESVKLRIVNFYLK